MLIYLSEDSQDSPYLKLFNSAYSNAPLIGVGGNAGLFDSVRFAASGGDCAIVYMDMVPGNKKLLNLYEALLGLYENDDLNVVIFPIVCSEYAFIRSVSELSSAVRYRKFLQTVLSKDVRYAETELAIKNHFDRDKTFEKFCKLFCKVCLNSCCSATGNAVTISNKSYFSGDCFCDRCQVRLSLFDKALLYLQQFPVVPGGYVGHSGEIMSLDDIVSKSHELVDEYNSWSDRFKKMYPHIRKRW